MKPLEQSILITLAYFDIFNFPLTREELFRYLWMPPRMGFGEFVGVLDSINSQKFQTKEGSYFLSGRQDVVETRKHAAVITKQKLIKAGRAVKLIRSIPFLKAVFVCNSVGAGMAREESDIDLFIVAEKNRIWIVRLFTNLILRLFGMRTYGSHQADRMCLSFYVDNDHLDLAPWRVSDDDAHFAYWLHMMVPVYDPEKYYEKFLKANKWVERFLPNVCLSSRAYSTGSGQVPSRDPLAAPSQEPRDFSTTPSVRRETRSGSGRNDNGVRSIGAVGRAWKKMWETMWRGNYGNTIENEAKKVQLTKMSFSLKEKSKIKDNGVVIDTGILKLHEHDTRGAIREKWLEKCKNI